ncbi:MAG: hypothetical protein PVI42_03800, partial [Desulfobacterales bacterium]
SGPPKAASIIKKIIKRAERSLRLVEIVSPTPRRATSTNLQFAVFNLQFIYLEIPGRRPVGNTVQAVIYL